MAYELVAVGSSWGGFEALSRLLGALPPDLGAAVAIAQHRTADSRRSDLATLLARRSPLPVREVDDKEPIEAGTVYLAPPDYHLIVEPGSFALSLEERVHYSRPSVDVLLETAADSYGPRLIGVILTGGNQDGAAGIARVRQRGGLALVQDPATAERREMPEAAIATDAPHRVVPLEELGSLIGAVCTGSVTGAGRELST